MNSLKTTIASVVLLLAIPLSAQSHAAPKRPASYYAFRNSGDTPVPGNYPIFHMSDNYPAAMPGECTECKWLQLDVNFATSFPPAPAGPEWSTGHWDQYMQLILDYVREGQDPNLRDQVGYQTKVGGKTRWFNVPWMAFDDTAGREFIHGTTNERTARVSDLEQSSVAQKKAMTNTSLAPMVLAANPKFRGVSGLALENSCDQTYEHGFETWSVGFYNPWGGYAIGKAFPRTGLPHIVDYMGSKMPDGLPFPKGTVVVKVLTTSAPVDCVPQLRGAPEWHVNRHKRDSQTGLYKCEREVQTSRILQVDVAVVDPRSPTRWVYGTFAYNGKSEGQTFWERLVPLGLQWGADPWSFPAVPQDASLKLQQTVLNPASNNVVVHYGCGNRLAGPVDNKESSCISCHSSAYAAPNGAPSTMATNVPPSFGFDGMCVQYSLDNAAYFQNQQPPQHFPGGRFPDAMSLDTSLQLEVAFDQYGIFHTTGNPLACSNTEVNQIPK